jgi:hypothetical protein
MELTSRMMGRLQQILRLVGDLGGERVEIVAGLLGELVGRGPAAVVGEVDGVHDHRLAGEDELDLRPIEEQMEVVEGGHVERVRDGDPQQPLLAPAEREQSMLLGEADRHLREDAVVDLFGIEAGDDGESLLVAEGVEDLVGVQEALFHEDVGEALVALGLAQAGTL